MTECGYTWEYIDRNMTLPKLNALIERWKIVPPLSAAVAGIAAFLGVTFDTQQASENAQDMLAKAKSDAMALNNGGR